MQRQRGAAPRGIGSARRARGERGGVEPDQHAVHEHERGRERVGAHADEADARRADEGRGHGQAHQPLAAEADRRLVAHHAGPRADEPHGHRHHRRRDPRAAGVGRRHHVGQERDRPAPQRVHLPGVGTIGQRVGHGGSVAQDRPEVEEPTGRRPDGRARPRRGPDEHDEPGRERGEPGRGERAAPSDPLAERTREHERERARDADAGRVPGHRPGHQRGLDPVRQQLEPGHVGTGPPDPGQRPRRRRAPEPVGEHGEAEVTRDGQGDAGEVDLAGIHAVGQGDQDGNRQRVGGVEDPGDPARFPVREMPLRDEPGKQRGPGIRPDLGAHLGRADRGDEAGRSQRAGFRARTNALMNLSSTWGAIASTSSPAPSRKSRASSTR